MRSILTHYLQTLAEKRANSQSTKELSLRDVLSEALNATARQLGKTVQFVGEGKQTTFGKRPDYIATRNDLPIGYIEAEKPETRLSHLTGAAKTQNEAFIAELDNFLLTNHFDFRLYAGAQKKPIAEVTLPTQASDLTEEHINAWEALFARFLAGEPLPIKTPRDLALILARRARPLQRGALEALDDPESSVFKSYVQFQKDLLPNVSKAEFADIYAQTLVYGLFAARTLVSEQQFDVQTAARAIRAIPLVASLFNDWEFRLPAHLDFELQEVGAVLKTAPIDSIRTYFEKRTGRADPMIDFYEPFLSAYSPGERELRGVYYTPEPVVGYIVRSVSEILQRDFGRALTDHSVQILDPATGTGSFLFAVLDEIHRQMARIGAWDSQAAHNTLNRLFGLELMVAPYTIAHLKIGLQLAGFDTPARERLNIYLSNTLDDVRNTIGSTRELGEEIQHADAIKSKHPILVVLGNPPYSGHSANVNFRMVGDRRQLTEVGKRVESYKTGVPGLDKPAQAKWLQDDYVKFIAFAQNRIAQTGEGIVAFITNHGYLDNPTFRGMRKSLMESFDELYVLDLHGNSKKKEVTPDGSKDQNVFDIQQGVSILLAVKHRRPKGTTKVFHADLWGERSSKYEALVVNDVTTTVWQKLSPAEPFYLFVPRDEDLAREYEKGWRVPDIFSNNGDPAPGIVTTQDEFAISFSAAEAKEKVRRLLTTNTEAEARSLFRLCSQNQWNYHNAKRDLPTQEWESQVAPILYRPFDVRFTVYNPHVAVHRRDRVMRHMNRRDNLGFITARSNKSPFPNHFLATRLMSEAKTGESTTQSALFPLYLFSEGLFGPEKRSNISEKFLTEIAGITGEKPSPETVFYYVYARLHSPRYRARYAAFLKTDFPRVPLPASPPELERWSHWGEQLVALHTLDTKAAPVLNEARFPVSGTGANVVEKVSYDASENELRFNSTRGFKNVPPTVWEWKIGGYQVAKKWLDDRKGRTLDFADLSHFGRTLVALDETRRVMTEIEAFESSGGESHN